MIEKGYKYAWLDKALMYHDVLPRKFWADIKVASLNQDLPKLIKLHPRMREFLPFKVVWAPLFKYVFSASLIAGLVLIATGSPWLGSGLMLMAFFFTLLRVLRITRNYNISLYQKLFIFLPHRLVFEPLLGFYLIYGSIKHRSLVI
jgi:hypothetical protein